MLFNMITPGLNPFHLQADENDKIYKYIFLDRHDLFKAIIKHEFGFELKMCRELFDIMCFSLSYKPNERLSFSEIKEKLVQIYDKIATEAQLKEHLELIVKRHQISNFDFHQGIVRHSTQSFSELVEK